MQDLTALKVPCRNNLTFRGALRLLPGTGGGDRPRFPILSSEGEGGFAISFCLWSLCSLAVGQQFLCLGCLLAGGHGRVLGTARGSAGRVRGQAGAVRGGVGGLPGAAQGGCEQRSHRAGAGQRVLLSSSTSLLCSSGPERHPQLPSLSLRCAPQSWLQLGNEHRESKYLLLRNGVKSTEQGMDLRESPYLCRGICPTLLMPRKEDEHEA